MNGNPENPPLIGVTNMVAVNILLVVFLMVPLIGETLEPVPPAVSVSPGVNTTLDQLNKVDAGTVPFTPSTGTIVYGTSVQTVVEYDVMEGTGLTVNVNVNGVPFPQLAVGVTKNVAVKSILVALAIVVAILG